MLLYWFTVPKAAARQHQVKMVLLDQENRHRRHSTGLTSHLVADTAEIVETTTVSGNTFYNKLHTIHKAYTKLYSLSNMSVAPIGAREKKP